jgi:hypothetical protein
VGATNGRPDFAGLQIGNYIDGPGLSAIPAENGGTAGQAWNDACKNNRIVISGFNTYPGAGSPENTKNRILFTFVNCPLTKRMNASNDNSGGYRASGLRAFLEGTGGNGTGDKSGVTTAAFMNALKAQIGNVLYTISKLHSVKSSNAWANYTVFPPSEIEIYGYPEWGDEGVYLASDTATGNVNRAGSTTNVQFPLFAQSYKHRIKRYNGSRQTRRLQNPIASSASAFCSVDGFGHTHTISSAGAVGCAPAFCAAQRRISGLPPLYGAESGKR